MSPIQVKIDLPLEIFILINTKSTTNIYCFLFIFKNAKKKPFEKTPIFHYFALLNAQVGQVR
jgi:hypothetical protein